MAAHYTAVIEITKTTHSPATEARYGQSGEPARRDVDDVARVVVRASELDALRERIAAHASLIEDVDL